MSEEDLENRLRKWLLAQGYPLELRVASSLSAGGLDVVHGHYYLDLETSVDREIDLLATARRELNDEFSLLRVDLAIECKSKGRAAKPWVVLASQHAQFGQVASVAQRIVTDTLETMWFERACHDPYIQETDLFQMESVPGFSLVRASLSEDPRNIGEDQAYASLMQAGKAAIGVCDWLDRASADGDRYTLFGLVIPILLVEAPLFRCALSESGELGLRRIDQATVVWRRQFNKKKVPSTIVIVLTESALPEFIETVSVAADRLALWLKGEFSNS